VVVIFFPQRVAYSIHEDEQYIFLRFRRNSEHTISSSVTREVSEALAPENALSVLYAVCLQRYRSLMI